MSTKKSSFVKLSLLKKLTLDEAKESLSETLEKCSLGQEKATAKYTSNNQFVEQIALTFESFNDCQDFLKLIESEYVDLFCTNDFVICSDWEKIKLEENEGLNSLIVFDEISNESELNPENILEFHFNKPIEVNDEDAVIMFLENCKASGGGEISHYKLDPKRRLLTVNYNSHLKKKRVLSKRQFIFGSYKFTANEEFKCLEFPNDMKTMILRNFQLGEDKMNVQLYAENLVDESNNVKWIKNSNLFKQTFVINLENEYQLTRVKKQLTRRPTLHGNTIEFLEAHSSKTCIIIIPQDTEKKISVEVLELYFSNKKRSGISEFAQLYDMGSFALIRFNSEEDALTVLERKHVVSNKVLVIEYLHSKELFEQFKQMVENEKIEMPISIEGCHDRETENADYNPFDQKPIVSQENNSLEAPLKPNTPTLVNYEATNFLHVQNFKKESPEFNQPISDNNKNTVNSYENNYLEELVEISQPILANYQEPMKMLDLTKEPNAKCFNLLDKIHYKKFEKTLSDLNAIVSVLSEDTLKIELKSDIVYKQMTPNEFQFFEDRWHNDVQNCVKNFFAQFKEKRVKHRGCEIKSIEYDRIGLNLAEVDPFHVDVFGLCNLVDAVCQKIENTVPENILEEVHDLKLNEEIRILYVNKYMTTMKESFPNLQISIKPKLGKVIYNGVKAEIELAITCMRDILSEVMVRSKVFNDIFLKFFSKKEKHFADWIKKNDFQCVLEVDKEKNRLNVYSTIECKIIELLKCLNAEITSLEFDLEIIEDKAELKYLCSRMDLEPALIYEINETNKILTLCGFNCQEFYEELSCLAG